MIRYLSLCSGIEAFSCAVHDMPEFVPVAFSEIEPVPCKVLAHHYPDVPNLGDMTKIDGSKYRGAVDLVVGGTPCQGFSVAGKRGGLDDPRSGLALKFVEIVNTIRPRWLLWENVPGALSTNCGRDFGTFVKALDDVGHGVAWRIIDAQFFGVPQRRRRIFLVGYLGDYKPAAAVLFEPKSLRGDSEKVKEQGKEIARCITTGIGTRLDAETDTFVIGTLAASGAGTSRPAGQGNELDFCIPEPTGIRRLTPVECERLQGFPDNYTNIDGASDTARYKALGNSMAVPCMRWIAQRMLAVDNKIAPAETI